MSKNISTKLWHRPSIPKPRCRFLHISPTYRVKNYYEILGLPRNANIEQIKASYYEKAKRYHPDAGEKQSPAKFQEISEAYEVLTNQAKRRAYDSETASGARFGTTFRDDITRSAHKPAEPISMMHVKYVHKAMNREEKPLFRPFEDHCYKGTLFNRFEYRRDWDPEAKRWVYSRRDTALQYEREMEYKTKTLVNCLSLFMTSTLLIVIYFRFIEPMKSREETPERTSGIYFLYEDDK